MTRIGPTGVGRMDKISRNKVTPTKLFPVPGGPSKKTVRKEEGETTGEYQEDCWKIMGEGGKREEKAYLNKCHAVG
jgi:hypothetical protein